MDTRKGGRSSNYKVAMKGHKSCKKSNLHYNLTSQYSLAAFICVFMFPYLTNHFVLTSFPYVWASLCNPKCLFVVVNVIVIFLVGESRAGASCTGTASPVNEIYEEYVKRGRRMRRSAEMKKLPHDQEEEKRAEAAGERLIMIRGGSEEVEEKMVVENEEELKGEEKQKEEVKKKVVHENEEDKLKEKQKEEEEEEEGKGILVIDENEKEKKGKEKKEREEESELMPREELNMRVEAFIARVNKQRQLESRLVSIRPTCLG